MKAVNIMWDVDYDGDENMLPTEIVIPEGMKDEEEISDYLSDLTGYCHEGFKLIDDENNDEYIKEAIFESIWDNGVTIKIKCKVNIFTRQVIDIDKVDVEGLDILQSEHIWLNNKYYEVYAEDDERLYTPCNLEPVFYY